MCGADCWTDHRLVISKLNLRIPPVRRPQGKKVLKKLDVSKLKQDNKRQAFVNDLCNRLDALEHSSEDVDGPGQKRETKAQVRSGKRRP